MKKVCMVVQNPMVKGGIAAVVNGYHGSQLEKDYNIIYVESYSDGGKFTKLLKGICGYIHFAGVLLFNRPNLVHIHSSFGPSFYRKIPFIYMASWAGIPIVNHIHGADFDKFYVNASDKKKKLIKKIYSKCSRLIALSEVWKERLNQIVPDDRIAIIENYSILHEDVLTERFKRSCNNQVLFLGELGNVKFVLCGAGSDVDEKAIRKLIHENCIEKNVEFSEWVRGKEKDKILRESDVFFLPSYNEGMPMSILDAMGYGLPVVSTNVGGIPKIVHNGENGFCCEPGDVNGMADAIVCLLNNNKTMQEAAQKSIKIVKDKYSLNSHIALLEKVYQEVMSA